MTPWKVQVAVVIVIFIGLFAIVNLIRKRNLELKYALTWLLLGISLMIIVVVPGALNYLSILFGIYTPVNLVFFLGFVFSLVVIFTLTMSVSRNSNRVRKMAQKIALNEYRTYKHDKEIK